MNMPTRASDRVPLAAFLATSRCGASLILSVLLLAAITILAGFGRLAMYRNQVKLRLDREREIQQEFATRSVMRWLESYYEENDQDLPSGDVPFRFPTVRGDIGALLCPADPVFPRKNAPSDFDIGKTGRNELPFGGYVTATPGLRVVARDENAGESVVCLADKTSSTHDVNSLAIDIAETRAPALWTDSDFGLRYLVYITDFCRQDPGVADSDLLRFSVTPLETPLRAEGGTPAARFAIWVEQDIPEGWETTGAAVQKARLRLFAKAPDIVGSGSLGGTCISSATVEADKSKGIQLASTMASLIQQEKASVGSDIRATTTYATIDLDKAVRKGFTAEFAHACREGVRLTVEVEVRRPRSDEATDKEFKTAIRKIAVTPAYEYYTPLSWSGRDGTVTEEISTVIRCDPGIHGEASEGTIATVTYDTHGTYANRKGHVGNVR